MDRLWHSRPVWPFLSSTSRSFSLFLRVLACESPSVFLLLAAFFHSSFVGEDTRALEIHFPQQRVINMWKLFVAFLPVFFSLSIARSASMCLALNCRKQWRSKYFRKKVHERRRKWTLKGFTLFALFWIAKIRIKSERFRFVHVWVY